MGLGEGLVAGVKGRDNIGKEGNWAVWAQAGWWCVLCPFDKGSKSSVSHRPIHSTRQ